jgi:hypothetical protein
MSYSMIIMGILPSVLYALAGLIDAIRKKEQVQWALFWKTILVGAVASGIISSQTGDMLIQFTSTGLITYLCDKVLNAVLRIYGLAE